MDKHTLTQKEIELIKQIRNVIMHKGDPPSVRELMDLLTYKSPRSISVLLDSLFKKGLIKRNEAGALQIIDGIKEDESKITTVDIPLVGFVACGTPIFAEENITDRIPVDVQIAKPPYRYFLLEASGDSMDLKDIDDGDLLLVRQQQTANDGDIVVALINDEATVKEFKRAKGVVVLKPHSRNSEHKQIIVTENLIIQGVVVSIIPKV